MVAVVIVVAVLSDGAFVVQKLVRFMQERCWVGVGNCVTGFGHFVAGECDELVGQELNALVLVSAEM